MKSCPNHFSLLCRMKQENKWYAVMKPSIFICSEEGCIDAVQSWGDGEETNKEITNAAINFTLL